jgi:hypothetical protein
MPVYEVTMSLNPEGEGPPPEEGGFWTRIASMLGVSEGVAMAIVFGGAGLLLILLLRK